MDRRRIAAALVATLILAFAVTTVQFQPQREPRPRVLVELEDERILVCFSLFLFDALGETTQVPVPCLHWPNPALPGTYNGGAAIQVFVDLMFLDPGNATCPGWYYDRYDVFYGVLHGFGVEGRFLVESWNPVGPWDVIRRYGETSTLVIRMPDEPYEGPLNLTLTGALYSYERHARCPSE